MVGTKWLQVFQKTLKAGHFSLIGKTGSQNICFSYSRQVEYVQVVTNCQYSFA